MDLVARRDQVVHGLVHARMSLDSGDQDLAAAACTQMSGERLGAAAAHGPLLRRLEAGRKARDDLRSRVPEALRILLGHEDRQPEERRALEQERARRDRTRPLPEYRPVALLQ